MALAQEHHHSIVVLSEQELQGSAAALLRVQFEAYVRGEWLFSSATDDQINLFIDGGDPPKLDQLLSSIERQPEFQQGALSNIKRHHCRAMCAYTHTGSLHLQRWQKEMTIEPNYSQQEIAEVLYFSELVATLAVASVAKRSDRPQLEYEVVQAFSRRPK